MIVTKINLEIEEGYYWHHVDYYVKFKDDADYVYVDYDECVENLKKTENIIEVEEGLFVDKWYFKREMLDIIQDVEEHKKKVEDRFEAEKLEYNIKKDKAYNQYLDFLNTNYQKEKDYWIYRDMKIYFIEKLIIVESLINNGGFKVNYMQANLKEFKMYMNNTKNERLYKLT